MSDETRPLWWPKCPWPEEEFPLGVELQKRIGWETAEREIYDRLEREMHAAALAGVPAPRLEEQLHKNDSIYKNKR